MAKVKTGFGWPHDVTKSDLIVDHYRGSGNGGQKKQKTSSGVRLTHKPTGLTAKCDEHREQSKNLQVAFQKLADLLVPLMKMEAKKERYASGDKRIRTYSEKDQRVVDTRIEGKIFNYNGVLIDGNLEEIINSIKEKESKDET